MYFDELMAWRSEQNLNDFDKLPSLPKVIVKHSVDLQLELHRSEDDLKCDFDVQTNASMQMSVFDLPPPRFPRRIVIVTFEVVSGTSVHIVFSGNTQPFQKGFVSMNIKGVSHKLASDDQYGEYYRVVSNMELKDVKQSACYLKNIFGDDCLRSSPIVVRMKETSWDTTLLEELFEELRSMENVRMEVG